jgi:hypothetical protein
MCEVCKCFGLSLLTITALFLLFANLSASDEIPVLRSQFAALTADFERLSAESVRLPARSAVSAILSDFPHILADLRGKRFDILWRGSR